MKIAPLEVDNTTNRQAFIQAGHVMVFGIGLTFAADSQLFFTVCVSCIEMLFLAISSIQFDAVLPKHASPRLRIGVNNLCFYADTARSRRCLLKVTVWHARRKS